MELNDRQSFNYSELSVSRLISFYKSLCVGNGPITVPKVMDEIESLIDKYHYSPPNKNMAAKNIV